MCRQQLHNERKHFSHSVEMNNEDILLLLLIDYFIIIFLFIIITRVVGHLARRNRNLPSLLI